MGRVIRNGCMALFLSIAIALSFFLPRRNLRTVAQVAGYSIDEIDEVLSVTFEVYVPLPDQPIGEMNSLVTVRGKSIEECIQSAKRIGGKELYISNASILIIGEDDDGSIGREVVRFYKKFRNNNMDLAVVYAKNQTAEAVFNRKGKILSTEIAESVEMLNIRQTVRDLMNKDEKRVWIVGDGNYEIVS